MAINTAPIFSKQGDIQWSTLPLLSANVAKDGTGTVATVYTAGPDGAFAQRLVARALGTNIASVLRVFVNNGGSNASSANNSLIAELALAATTLTENSAQPPFELPLNFPMPPNFKLLCTLGTAVATGYELTVFGGNYTE